MEVRAMMRIATAKQKLSMSNESSGSNQQLSGKDKIKVLKLMKAKLTAAENPPKSNKLNNLIKINILSKKRKK